MRVLVCPLQPFVSIKQCVYNWVALISLESHKNMCCSDPSTNTMQYAMSNELSV